MMSFKDYLRETEQMVAEAIPLGHAMQYRRQWDPKTYDRIFKNYPVEMRDRNAFRLYLQYETDYASQYVAAPYPIANALHLLGYLATDYAAGLATQTTGKRVMKIGKLLAKEPDLLKTFMNDPRRALKKHRKKMVAISRHPYDVAGMSSGRGWTSCMNIADGMNSRYVMDDVMAGTIIAYLIYEDDKNIQHPISRILIKPFHNYNDSSDTILVAEEKQYGTNDETFGEIVEEWIKTVNGSDKQGLYCIAPELYKDSKSTKYVGKPDGSVEGMERFCKLQV